jgi:hypothetical protein
LKRQLWHFRTFAAVAAVGAVLTARKAVSVVTVASSGAAFGLPDCIDSSWLDDLNALVGHASGTARAIFEQRNTEPLPIDGELSRDVVCAPASLDDGRKTSRVQEISASPDFGRRSGHLTGDKTAGALTAGEVDCADGCGGSAGARHSAARRLAPSTLINAYCSASVTARASSENCSPDNPLLETAEILGDAGRTDLRRRPARAPAALVFAHDSWLVTATQANRIGPLLQPHFGVR